MVCSSPTFFRPLGVCSYLVKFWLLFVPNSGKTKTYWSTKESVEEKPIWMPSVMLTVPLSDGICWM